MASDATGISVREHGGQPHHGRGDGSRLLVRAGGFERVHGQSLRAISDAPRDRLRSRRCQLVTRATATIVIAPWPGTIASIMGRHAPAWRAPGAREVGRAPAHLEVATAPNTIDVPAIRDRDRHRRGIALAWVTRQWRRASHAGDHVLGGRRVVTSGCAGPPHS